MFVPFVDLKSQYQKISSEINNAISYVFEKSDFILGEKVRKFEEEFCQYLGGGSAVGVNSGTDALYLSLLACGISSGDEVITVSHTFIATYLAIVQTGATPILIDINPSTFNIDPNKIEAKITDKTKAIMPVHLYGYPANMAHIAELAEKYNLFVIEDACQAHGSKINGKKTGLFGDFGCFSFYPTKNLGAYGDGGVIVARTEMQAKKLRALRNYGQSKKYHHDMFGLNSRMDEMQAAILGVKLRHLDGWNDARRNIAKTYLERIQSDYVSCSAVPKGIDHVYHLFVVISRYRDQLQKFLAERGIHTQIHYPIPVHLQKCFINRSDKEIKLPITEKICRSILSLPIYPELKQETVEYVIRAVNAFSPE